MPIYEYKCCDCRTTFERKQRFDEEPVASCPECSGKARRVIHSVPVLFKGSGFYCTDHGRVLRDIPNRKNGDKESEVETKTERMTETKSDSVPQTATAAKFEESV